MLAGIVVGLLCLMGLLLLPWVLGLMGLAIRGLWWVAKWGVLAAVVVWVVLWLLLPAPDQGLTLLAALA